MAVCYAPCISYVTERDGPAPGLRYGQEQFALQVPCGFGFLKVGLEAFTSGLAVVIVRATRPAQLHLGSGFLKVGLAAVTCKSLVLLMRLVSKDAVRVLYCS